MGFYSCGAERRPRPSGHRWSSRMSRCSRSTSSRLSSSWASSVSPRRRKGGPPRARVSPELLSRSPSRQTPSRHACTLMNRWYCGSSRSFHFRGGNLEFYGHAQCVLPFNPGIMLVALFIDLSLQVQCGPSFALSYETELRSPTFSRARRGCAPFPRARLASVHVRLPHCGPGLADTVPPTPQQPAF